MRIAAIVVALLAGVLASPAMGRAQGGCGTADSDSVGMVNQDVEVQPIHQVTVPPVAFQRVSNPVLQPTVVAWAARQAKTESVLNRPATGPSAISKVANHSATSDGSAQSFS